MVQLPPGRLFQREAQKDGRTEPRPSDRSGTPTGCFWSVNSNSATKNRLASRFSFASQMAAAARIELLILVLPEITDGWVGTKMEFTEQRAGNRGDCRGFTSRDRTRLERGFHAHNLTPEP